MDCDAQLAYSRQRLDDFFKGGGYFDPQSRSEWDGFWHAIGVH